MTRGALYVQAIRGPLVLITLGALFAIHQAGVISFARTWPLIIIVVGLVKLAERLLVQPGYPNAYAPGTYPPNQYPQKPPPPPSGGPRV
jgi:hypothetical protein